MAAQTVAQMTADGLLAMPHNGYRYELVQGELRQMALAGRQHGRIAAKIGGCLEAFVVKNGLGERILNGGRMARVAQDLALHSHRRQCEGGHLSTSR